MELRREKIAAQALQQNVDLERLFTELLEGLVLCEHAGKLGQSMSIVSQEGEKLLKKIRAVGYAGLGQGKWKALMGMEDYPGESIFEKLESLIATFGRYCKVADTTELRACVQAMQILDKDLRIDMFLHCLAETAVNQQLDEIHIGRTEMNRIRSLSDANLHQESNEITELTYRKIFAVFRGS